MVDEEIRLVDIVVVDINTLIEVAVFIQEDPLDELDGEPDHATANVRSVAKVVPVYTSRAERSIRCWKSSHEMLVYC